MFLVCRLFIFIVVHVGEIQFELANLLLTLGANTERLMKRKLDAGLAECEADFFLQGGQNAKHLLKYLIIFKKLQLTLQFKKKLLSRNEHP